MEILLIVPKYNLTKEKDYNYTFPLGLGYISSVLKKNNYSVNCINLNHLFGLTSEIVKSVLDKKKYDVVCTGGNALIFHSISTIAKAVREHKSKPKLIIGGPIITGEPELMIKELKPDFGVISEGEITIIDLLENLKLKKEPKNINGIIYTNKEGKIIKNPPREFIRDLEKLPYPDLEGLGFKKLLDNTFPNIVYINNAFDYPRTYPILGSRGCPFNCSFCWHDMRYRARSIKDIIQELKINVPKYKINNISIFDDCFSAKKERVYEFCKEFNKLRKEIPWEIKWSCQLMVTSVDKELLKTLKDSGCFSISYGFESYSPIILKSMRKPITPEQIDYAFKETMRAGIGIQANFILGDIAETRETARQTLNYWKTQGKGQIGLGFIQPYPGSDIYNHCIKKGIIKDKLEHIKKIAQAGYGEFSLNMTDNMNKKEFVRLNKEVLDLVSKNVYFVRAKKIKIQNRDKKTYELRTNCPFCKREVVYGNCFLPQKYSFGIFMVCRKCGMRFFIVSRLHQLGYMFYPQVRALRNLIKKIIRSIKAKKV